MASATKMDIISNPLSAPFEAVREASLGGPLAYDKAGNPLPMPLARTPPSSTPSTSPASW